MKNLLAFLLLSSSLAFGQARAGNTIVTMVYNLPTAIHLAAQTGSISSQTLVSTAQIAYVTNGYFLIQCAAAASVATSSPTLAFTVSFTDPFGTAGRTVTSSTITLATTGAQPTWTGFGIAAASGAAITVSTTLTGTATYNFDCTAVPLF
jgi:hypothetical protein